MINMDCMYYNVLANLPQIRLYNSHVLYVHISLREEIL